MTLSDQDRANWKLSSEQLKKAIAYNAWAAEHVFSARSEVSAHVRISSLPPGFVTDYHGDACYAPDTAQFAEATTAFQLKHDLKPDGMLGTRTLGTIHRHYVNVVKRPERPILLTEDDRDRIVSYTVKFEAGGHENPYGAVNLDFEYEGHFDLPKRVGGKFIDPFGRKHHKGFQPHRASKYHPSGGYHIGLSYGAWQAAQEPGSLGQLLVAMREAEFGLFQKTFTPACWEMIEVTTGTNRRMGTFSVRTRKVAGAYLWEEPWVSRFKAAAEIEAFRRVQRLWVADTYLTPALEVAEDLDMDTAADLAVLFDIAVQFGVAGMKGFVRKARVEPTKSYDPGKIEAVIAALPKSHRHRREQILKAADREIRYTW